MADCNFKEVNYLEIRYEDGSAQILEGEEAQKFFERMLESFCRDFFLGFRPGEYNWKHIKSKGGKR